MCWVSKSGRGCSPSGAAGSPRRASPFVSIASSQVCSHGLLELGDDREGSDEHRDTYFMYGGTWVWLDEPTFNRLPVSTRRALMAERRRTSHPKPSSPWPSRFEREGDECMRRWVEASVRPSRHDTVASSTWRNASSVVPGARDLAGRFPTGSGPNCFGTVMAAAGVADARETWMLQEPFWTWLGEQTTPVRGTGYDEEPGIVLVWHEHGQLAHAAVTIGDGWAISKPSQAWSSPTVIWTVRETIGSWRIPGTRLSRHRLHASSGRPVSSRRR